MFKIYSIQILTGLLLTAAAGGSEAAEPRFAVTPLVGYRDGGNFTDNATDRSVHLDGHMSYALALSMAAAEGGQYELLYDHQSTRVNTTSPLDMKIEYLHVGGLTPVGDSENIEPYVGAGIGATRFTPGLSALKDITRFSASLAGGFKVPLGQHVALRFELRGYATWLQGKTDLFCVSSASGAGCLIQANDSSLFQYEALGGVAFKF